MSENNIAAIIGDWEILKNPGVTSSGYIFNCRNYKTDGHVSIFFSVDELVSLRVPLREALSIVLSESEQKQLDEVK